MFYYPPTALYIREGIPFEINGIQYPANWLNLSTPEQKQELGLEEVITTNMPKNDQYYWVSQQFNEATLTYINTPKDLEDIRKNQINNINQVAYTLLQPTDWYVTRLMERQIPIPADISTYRQSIVDTCNSTINQYKAAISVDEIASIVVVWESEPGKVI